MTANCLGKHGTYQYMCSRPEESEPTVWVLKRYNPTDLRVTAPTPRHKPTSPEDPPPPPKHWVPTHDHLCRSNARPDLERQVYSSQPATRCEDHSTLREMLPSRGHLYKQPLVNWGTGGSNTPKIVDNPQRRFPHVNSEPTR